MRILVVEDEEISAALMRGTLTSMGHQVTVETDGLAAWQRLQIEHFPLVLSDWMMPGMDGPTLCRRIRGRSKSPYTYFIMFSALDQHADRLAGLRAGADDFLIKPIEADELAIRLEIARRIIAIQERLELRNAQLAELATTDELTGLKNRRCFDEALGSQFALADRQRSPLSLVMMDIDHFKAHNDALGHQGGDEILCEVAEVLRAGCRVHETAARYGGEEFVVLLPATGPVVARGVAERLRLAIERRDWRDRPVTASFGVATTTALTGTPEDLVHEADQALYHSKHHGRNQVTHGLDLDVLPQVEPATIPEARGSPADRADRASGKHGDTYDNIVDSLSKVLNLRDHETSGHSKRVTALTMKMARSLNFSEEELCHIRRGVLLHDIGKVGVPDAILHKPGPLSDAEWVGMRKHPSHAREMLEPIAFLRPALEIPYAHHERWDGSGYPRGLKGERIPLAARVFAVVDAYDALTHDRPYRAAWSKDKALAQIDGLAGVHFDPEIVVALHQALGQAD